MKKFMAELFSTDAMQLTSLAAMLLLLPGDDAPLNYVIGYTLTAVIILYGLLVAHQDKE